VAQCRVCNSANVDRVIYNQSENTVDVIEANGTTSMDAQCYSFSFITFFTSNLFQFHSVSLTCRNL
jgi:hypothetical protein